MNKTHFAVLLLACVVALLAGLVFGAGDTGNRQPPPKTTDGQAEQMSQEQLKQQVLARLTSAVTTSRSGEQIKWQVISSGGTDGASPSFVLRGTVAQTAVGEGSSTNFGLNQGYWQNFVAGGCCMPPIRGNVDYDAGDNIDISDLVYLVDYMFNQGPAPVCLEEADIDATGGIDISDLVYLVDYMFTGGPAPLAC